MNWEAWFRQTVFVTGNLNKVKEAERILGASLKHATLEGIQEIQTASVQELIKDKAMQAHAKIGKPTLVEDSGLIFEAWNELPGALVKWFEVNVGCEGMLKMLDGFADRKARAVCCAAWYDGETMVVGTGEAAGSICNEIRGEGGFGWDVIFMPEGHDRTFAEMSAGEKDAISHRKRAFESLRKEMQLRFKES
ncbi:MAG: RdgB/HAM1 family non-canonical purine NTP pyrophosphatase [Candidatus Nitrohelix vancouverensis]|uniref:RdgB/HAM1 family non-canonical purine NTP pyrophosphatase n=1 Tax=Candidatus Nitrohelix vancouverensis TaxID=2705534 RepID=A0A7T0C3F6_9BACT|nr:MAG: RdgB/HAM1 family non-canonical purine NTP pyrophosphatase [Candidatus Nitrohelix vancouverensis]